MEILSREYGWLPKDILSEDSEIINKYIEIIKIRRIIDKNHEKELENKSKLNG